MLRLKQQLSQIAEKEGQEITAYLHRLKQESPAQQKKVARLRSSQSTTLST